MPAGSEVTDNAWAVIAVVCGAGGTVAGVFARNFLKSFFNPEPRTEEKRVVLESADLTEPSTMRNVGAKLTEMHPAVLATNQNVAKALVILEAQEHRAAVREEAERMFEEMKERHRGDDRRRDDGEGGRR